MGVVKHRLAIVMCALITLAVPLASQAVSLRVVGNFSGNKKQVDGVERPFFSKLGKEKDFDVTYNTMDALGVKAADELRLVRNDVFDIASVQIGMAAQDDPTVEGVDLAGVAPDLATQRKVTAAYRPVMEKIMKTRFHAKLLTLWPFGPQIFYCKGPVNDVTDMSGTKVRVYTSSMARLVKGLDGSPVTIQFSEVYPSLQRNVVDCAVTAPTAGNSAKWPEVTDRFVPLSVSSSMQAHVMNLDKWNSLSPEQQQDLKKRFGKMEDRLWQIARNENEDAVQCNVGNAAECEDHTLYHMKLVKVTDADKKAVKEIAESSVIPNWASACVKVHPDCAKQWNRTVGKAVGLTAKPE